MNEKYVVAKHIEFLRLECTILYSAPPPIMPTISQELMTTLERWPLVRRKSDCIYSSCDKCLWPH